jgi:hypothetical protein
MYAAARPRTPTATEGKQDLPIPTEVASTVIESYHAIVLWDTEMADAILVAEPTMAERLVLCAQRCVAACNDSGNRWAFAWSSSCLSFSS